RGAVVAGATGLGGSGRGAEGEARFRVGIRRRPLCRFAPDERSHAWDRGGGRRRGGGVFGKDGGGSSLLRDLPHDLGASGAGSVPAGDEEGGGDLLAAAVGRGWPRAVTTVGGASGF